MRLLLRIDDLSNQIILTIEKQLIDDLATRLNISENIDSHSDDHGIYLFRSGMGLARIVA